MTHKKFISVNLPEDTVNELKLWRQAFSAVAVRPVTYDEIIKTMFEALKTTRPAETTELQYILDKHPELKESVKL